LDKAQHQEKLLLRSHRLLELEETQLVKVLLTPSTKPQNKKELPKKRETPRRSERI
jgi:hypothetical protein